VQMALTVVLFALAALLLDLRQKDTGEGAGEELKEGCGAVPYMHALSHASVLPHPNMSLAPLTLLASLLLRPPCLGISFSLLAVPIAFSWPYLAMLVWRMASREQPPSALFLTERGTSWFPLLAIVVRRTLALLFVLGVWAMPAAYEIMINTGLDVPIELLMVMVEGPNMRPNVVLFKLLIDLPVKMALFLRVGVDFAVIRAFASEMAAVCCWYLLHRRAAKAAKAM
jgi:hypothetical protein